jgi:hypothetical protein
MITFSAQCAVSRVKNANIFEKFLWRKYFRNRSIEPFRRTPFFSVSVCFDWQLHSQNENLQSERLVGGMYLYTRTLRQAVQTSCYSSAMHVTYACMHMHIFKIQRTSMKTLEFKIESTGPETIIAPSYLDNFFSTLFCQKIWSVLLNTFWHFFSNFDQFLLPS